MPFKSQAQRAFMHIHHPRLASRWEKETPKGKLPGHVREAEAEGPVTEMPHMDLDMDVGGRHLGVIDLRIERYPVPREERMALLRAFSETGVVGRLGASWIKFGPGPHAEEVTGTDAARLPQLPSDWERHMVNHIGENHIPRMTEVFAGRNKRGDV